MVQCFLSMFEGLGSTFGGMGEEILGLGRLSFLQKKPLLQVH